MVYIQLPHIAKIKKKTPKFFLEHLLAFPLQFAPTKISHYNSIPMWQTITMHSRHKLVIVMEYMLTAHTCSSNKKLRIDTVVYNIVNNCCMETVGITSKCVKCILNATITFQVKRPAVYFKGNNMAGYLDRAAGKSNRHWRPSCPVHSLLKNHAATWLKGYHCHVQDNCKYRLST